MLAYNWIKLHNIYINILFIYRIDIQYCPHSYGLGISLKNAYVNAFGSNSTTISPFSALVIGTIT